MIWPPSVRGVLVTEGVRGDGGILQNSKGERFLFNYIPEMFAAETAATEEEAARWLAGDKDAHRPPDLLTRDVVARAIRNEVREGRGSPHGGAFLNIATQLPADVIKRRLPSMDHQFKKLGDLDITKQPMEVGPTCHYVMGGVLVDADSAQSTVRGLYAAGEAAGGMHGANRLGGNSLSDLLVFGARAGQHAADYAKDLPRLPNAAADQIEAAKRAALRPFEDGGTENPYELQQELQQCMEDNVGIVRTRAEMEKGLAELQKLKERLGKVKVEGHRQYNPGWHLALDLRNLIIVSEAIAISALKREESRGGHTRDDFPDSNDEWERVNTVVRDKTGEISFEHAPRPDMPAELRELLN
jgi:succinate dehydrogenase / fumarate reductase flavoprotein subunit